MNEFFLSWGLLVLSVIFNAYGVFVIKLKLNQLGAIHFDSLKGIFTYAWAMISAPWVACGIVFFIASPFLFTVSLSRMDIVLAYPVQIGLNFFFLIVLAVVFLGETLTLYKIIGIVFIFVGIYFLNKVG